MRCRCHNENPRSVPASRHPWLEYFPTSICPLRTRCKSSLKLLCWPMVVYSIQHPMLGANQLRSWETCKLSCALANVPFGTWLHNTKFKSECANQREYEQTHNDKLAISASFVALFGTRRRTGVPVGASRKKNRNCNHDGRISK